MKIRKTLIFFLLGALVALPLKTYQLLTAVDYSTGFFKSTGVLNIILPVVLVLCVTGFFAVALTSRQYPKYSPNVKSVPMGIVSAITALAIGWNAAADLINQENAEFEGSAGLIYSCLGLICVLAFLFPAVSFFMGNNLVESRPVIMILPVVWMAVRMVLTFLQFTTRANIKESIYDLLMMVFMLLFLLFTAKFLSGAAENTARLMFASGCSAALFGALATIPRYILAFSGNSEFVQLSQSVRENYSASFADFMLVVFAVGMMLYASIPVRQRVPQRTPVQQTGRAEQRQPAVNQQMPYQRQPVRSPYAQGQMAARSPYMPQPQRRPVMQRPLPGAGPDAYTTRGAGMRVAEDFSELGGMRGGVSKYGGIDTFRDDMLSGRRALEVLESSMTADTTTSFDEEITVMRPTFTEGDIAEVNETPADSASAELEELNEEVTETLSSLFAQRENTVRAPKEAVITGAADEGAEIIPAIPETREPNYPPPPSARRAVSLGSGRRDGRLADRLNELEERRSRRSQKTPVGRVPVGRVPYDDYDDRYGMYDEEYDGYYDSPRDRYDEYDDDYEDDYADEYGDGYDDGYDEDYYDDVEYGTSEYYEYDEDYDEEYDEEYDDDYDEDYGEDYDDYDGDYDYDDEGYGAPRGGYNYW